MAWIEFHQALCSHHKLSTLCGELGIKKPQAAGHLAFLWCWALDNARDGNLTNISFRAIADAACWPKKPEAFIHGMRRAGFFCTAACEHQASEDDVWLHDWNDYAGRLIDKRMSDAKRKREKRTSVGHPADGAGTQPNHTIPNRTQPTTPAPDGGHPRAFRAFQNQSPGGLTPAAIQAIDGWAEDGFSDEWIAAACDEAGQQGGHKPPRYIETILHRWRREGGIKRGAKPPTTGAHTADEFADFGRTA